MTSLASDVLTALKGHSLVTAESITGGGIGAALTAVPGASSVYKGGIISYCDEVKAAALGVAPGILRRIGAVSAPVAEAMAAGARKALRADVAVSVTGLAGPDGDSYGNPVGTVFIGYADERGSCAVRARFSGTREEIRQQTVDKALELILIKYQETGH